MSFKLDTSGFNCVVIHHTTPGYTVICSVKKSVFFVRYFPFLGWPKAYRLIDFWTHHKKDTVLHVAACYGTRVPSWVRVSVTPALSPMDGTKPPPECSPC